MTRALFTILLTIGLAGSALAQTPMDFVRHGDGLAAKDRHDLAINAYERALAADPSLREALAPKLGRQYLWAGQTKKAISWLREYADRHPNDCDVRFDYALALSWNDDLRGARREYEQLQARCPGAQKQQARLRLAQILRWQDRPSRAEELYRQVLAEGDEAQQRDARTALGFIELDKSRNRGAMEVFSREVASAPSSSVDEGAAIAAVRLGDPRAVEDVLARAESRSPSRDLVELRSEWSMRDRMWLSPRTNAFRDADGTTFSSAELAASFGWAKRGRAEVNAGRSRLELNDDAIEDRWIGASVDHRFNPSFALVLGGRVHELEAIDFQPVTGELNLVFTPSDDTRIDASAARIIIADNLSALRNELEGTFVSLGLDQKVGFRTTLAAAADVTQWNTDNQRQRFRVNAIHRFEGVPRVTIEWPTLYQRYDEPFAFGLFSPRRYVETGPAVNVYRRFARVWNASAYVRGGVQQEDSNGWKRLATVRVALERDLHDVWALSGAFYWTNSNLASSTGFRRTSVTLGLVRRF